MRRLDNIEAISILFTIAMVPSYVIPARFSLDDRKCGQAWLITFILIIACSAVFNLITLNILNRVADVKQMESYQEVAYNISNSNRGYIFLISAAKFILLAVTAAYSIDYCAGYLTLLCVSNSDLSYGAIWAIYMVWVFVVGGALFLPYNKLRSESNPSAQTQPADSNAANPNNNGGVASQDVNN